MLEAIMQHLHNYFVVPGGVRAGEHVIASGALTCDYLQDGQYFRIVGSVFNDGVHQYPAFDLADETFTGEIWPLAVPAQLISLAREISAWNEANPDTGKASESFGGYSYTRATINGAPATWQSVFRGALNAWRKLP